MTYVLISVKLPDVSPSLPCSMKIPMNKSDDDETMTHFYGTQYFWSLPRPSSVEGHGDCNIVFGLSTVDPVHHIPGISFAQFRGQWSVGAFLSEDKGV